MNKPTSARPQLVPSVADYMKAFQKIEPEMTKNQRKLLIHHCEMPSHVTTVKELADFVGFKNYGSVNLQYGKQGKL